MKTQAMVTNVLWYCLTHSLIHSPEVLHIFPGPHIPSGFTMIDLCLFLRGTQQKPRAGTENMCSQQMRWVVKAGGSEVCTERGFSVDSSFKCDELLFRKPQHQQLGRMHTHSVTWVQWVYTNNQKGKGRLFRFPWWSWPFFSVMCFSAIWSPGLSTTVFLLLRPGKQADAYVPKWQMAGKNSSSLSL